ncbi:MAG TPA: DNA mismatch repair protein MutS [Clostridia bacterium]|jgi:DNA mismatch repair protein MutS|nr:DNA mismatch repair protein MutS [Clostridia bacterium]
MSNKAPELSEMMKHYFYIKEQYNDCIIFYRLGDFYEMFFDDALVASKVLNITLTGRDCGLSERAPMCGVPYHAADTYIAKLVQEGYKVAICEQLSTPADQKGMVKRDVVRVITPGTITDDNSLDSDSNNYLLSVYKAGEQAGFAWTDISTGVLKVSQQKFGNVNQIIDQILSIGPSEIISNKEAYTTIVSADYVSTEAIVKPEHFYELSFEYGNATDSILKFYKIQSIQALGIETTPFAVCALGALLRYVELTQKQMLEHVKMPQVIMDNNRMFLDFTTKRNLELVQTLIDNHKQGSLLGVLDKTSTSMGARELRTTILEPTRDYVAINNRLDVVEELIENTNRRLDVKTALSEIRDIERLCNKISYNSINPREVISIMISLKKILEIKNLLKTSKSKLLKSIHNELDGLPKLISIIEDSITENPPTTLKEGMVIKEGFDKELDKLRNAQKNANNWLLEYEQQQKETTNLKTLKVGYNKVFGYYIEVSNSYLDKVPDHYIRKQTLKSGERFITEELKNMEELILNSVERSIELETKIFDSIKYELRLNMKVIQQNATLISQLDVLISFAEVSVQNNYVRPLINFKNNDIVIKNGRHPVVESQKKSRAFIPNDITLNDDAKTLIITGPNMGGKSTYMRQVALIVLMCHMGCFVPAEYALIRPVDRVFTRIGASDNLAAGQSTFMVEMTEVANIINNSTSNSLILFDEIGRGTSTLDGLAIAWAIVEFVSLKINAYTLFATHYHELSELEYIIPTIKNYHLLIKYTGGEMVFLYKITRGSTNKSFGVEVASMAGVNDIVITRAKKIMELLEKTHKIYDIKEIVTSEPGKDAVPLNQIGFFEEDTKTKEILNIVDAVDINNCTPFEALTILSNLKNLRK